MEINRGRINEATCKGLLTARQADDLWAFLAARGGADRPSFRLTHILYYLSGMKPSAR